MNSIKNFFIAALVILIAVSAHTAPTDTDSTDVSTEALPDVSSNAQSDVSPSPPSDTPSSSPSDITSSTPSGADRGMFSSTPSGIPAATHAAASSFTCFNRSIGYYGDIDHDCKIYHFCLLGDYNGETVYQRISYLCLNETMFDQQALDCVEQSNMTAPCKESPNFYDQSNKMLRDAIVGNRVQHDSETTTPHSS